MVGVTHIYGIYLLSSFLSVPYLFDTYLGSVFRHLYVLCQFISGVGHWGHC
jgi:hypothetical protein